MVSTEIPGGGEVQQERDDGGVGCCCGRVSNRRPRRADLVRDMCRDALPIRISDVEVNGARLPSSHHGCVSAIGLGNRVAVRLDFASDVCVRFGDDLVCARGLVAVIGIHHVEGIDS
jgi:hypothetical protein